MPLSDDIRSGFSLGSRGFDESRVGSKIHRFRAERSPEAVIDGKNFGRANVARYFFPPDQPRIRFMIIENKWGNASEGGTNLQPLAMINLPLPTPLEDSFRVNYDTNFNYLDILGPLGRDQATGSVQALAGASVNRWKTVTLEAPDFRAFDMSWKLSPKTFQESQEIHKIVYRLRRGMTPELTAADTVFVYPRIYTLAFIPNVPYMYKFKPCVLQSLSVDHAGGQPVPSFYKSQGAESDSPPESLQIRARWIEVEYWIRRDYKGDDLPSVDPFDVFNNYNIVRRIEDDPDASAPAPDSPRAGSG